jgi:hypothetical protein
VPEPADGVLVGFLEPSDFGTPPVLELAGLEPFTFGASAPRAAMFQAKLQATAAASATAILPFAGLDTGSIVRFPVSRTANLRLAYLRGGRLAAPFLLLYQSYLLLAPPETFFPSEAIVLPGAFQAHRC